MTPSLFNQGLRTDPLIVENYFDTTPVSEALEDAISSMRRSGMPTSKSKSRVYLDGRLDLQAKSAFLHGSRKERRTRYCLEQLSKGADYCLSLNAIAEWNDALCMKLVELVISRLSLDLYGSGFQSYAFLGKYEITPFGFHTDPENSYLLHLGPAKKTVWLMYSEDYVQATGSTDNTHDIEPILNQATRLSLSPGTLLFIPKGFYHVFRSSEYSQTVGLMEYSTDLKSLMLNSFEQELEVCVPDCTDLEFISYQHMTISLASQVRDVSKRLGKVDIGRLLERYSMRLRSNGWIVTPPIRQLHLFDPLGTYCVHDLFPLFTQMDGPTIEIFARGRRALVEHAPASVAQVLSLLTQGKAVALADFQHPGMKTVDEAMMTVIRALVDCGALRRVAESDTTRRESL